MQAFQKEYRVVVLEAEDMEMDIFCALTNSNIRFISAIRSLVERATKIGLIKEDEVMQALTYNNLMKNFAQISNSSFSRIEELILQQIAILYSQVTDIRKFDMDKFLTDMLLAINPVFKMLHATYSKKLWKGIADGIVRNYILMLFTLSTQFKPTETKLFVDKIEKEKQLMVEVFASNLGPKDVEEVQQSVNMFIKSLTEPIEEIPIFLVKISVKLKGDFNDNCIVADLHPRKPSCDCDPTSQRRRRKCS